MLKKICNTLLAIIILAALALVGILGLPLVRGSQLFAVLTESMEPTYPVGSIVVIEDARGDEIQPNDVITFEASGFESVVTHRVIEVDAANRQLITKGDNNDNIDFYPVPFENVVGRVQYGIPYLGNLVIGMRTTGGILAMLWILLAVVVLVMLPGLAAKAKQRREAKKEQRTATRRQVYGGNNQAKGTPQKATPYKRGNAPRAPALEEGRAQT